METPKATESQGVGEARAAGETGSAQKSEPAIVIKSQWDERILYSGVGNIKGVLVLALKSGAYLRGAYLRGEYLSGADLLGADLSGADLRGAYLSGADLRGADLLGADLRGADLRGADPRGVYLSGADLRGAICSGGKIRVARGIVQIGPIGSRSDILLAFMCEDGVWIETGCFGGMLSEFENKVITTHSAGQHAREYLGAIALLRCMAGGHVGVHSVVGEIGATGPRVEDE